MRRQTPMGAVWLKKHNMKKDYPRSHLSIGSPTYNAVKDETVPAVIAVNDYSNRQISPPTEHIDLKGLEKPFDLLSTRSFIQKRNRSKILEPSTPEEWCHAVILQCWYQCIGGKNGKFHMPAEALARHTSTGINFFDKNKSPIDYQSVNTLPNIAFCTFLQARSTPQGDDGPEKSDSNSEKFPVPMAILPETLSLLPLSSQDRLYYHSLLRDIWSQISETRQILKSEEMTILRPQKRRVQKYRFKKEKVIKTTIGTPFGKILMNKLMSEKIKKTTDDLREVCEEIYEDIQIFMADNFSKREIEEMDMECGEESKLQDLRKRKELRVMQRRQVVSCDTSPLSSSNTYDSDKPESDTESSLSSMEDINVSLTPRKACDWAEDVIESAILQNLDMKIEKGGGTVVTWNKEAMDDLFRETGIARDGNKPEHPATENSNEVGLTLRRSAAGGLKPQMESVREQYSDQDTLRIIIPLLPMILEGITRS